jgi:hypothetical protein
VLASTSPSAARRLLAALTLPGTVRVGVADPPVRRLATGLPRLDAALDGGLPRGRLTELTGPVTSGKTSVLLACLAAATQRGEVTALIDLPDCLHPATAHAAGIELTRLLWVRPPSLPVALRCTELLLEAGGFGFIAVDLGAPVASHHRQLRAPMWPRLAQAARRSDAALAIVADQRLAGSFAALSLTLTARSHWSGGAWPLFDGMQLHLTVARTKLNAARRTESVQLKTENQQESDIRRSAFRFQL